MIKIDSTQTQSTLTLQSSNRPVQFSVGQRIQAQVIEVTPNLIRLQIGQQIISAKYSIREKGQPTVNIPQTHIATKTLQTLLNTQEPLNTLLQTNTKISPGQQLTLEVVQQSEQTILKILQRPPNQTVNEQLKTLLPKQLPLQTLLSSITEAINSPTVKELPEKIQKALQQLIQNMPTKSEIQTSSGLKQAIQNSGLFFETRLLHTQLPQPRDFKSGLVQLFFLLNQNLSAVKSKPQETRMKSFNQSLQNYISTSPPPFPIKQPTAQPRFTSIISLFSSDLILRVLRQLTEGTLARIQVNQLAHRSEDVESLYAFEIPIQNGKHSDVLQIQLEQERKRHGEKNKQQYTVTLALNLDGLGPLHAKLMLRQDSISTTFWAEKTQTVELIRKNLPLLYAALEESGFAIQQLNCYNGTPPSAPKKETQNILDERI